MSTAPHNATAAPHTGPTTPPEADDDILAFTPVPLARARAQGWSPEAQVAFIRALGVMGSVGMAARAVGLGRRSAYRLRERPGAESFAAAWDRALASGRWRQYSVAMERALEGHTIVRVHRGGSVSVMGGPDIQVMNAALREAPARRSPRDAAPAAARAPSPAPAPAPAPSASPRCAATGRGA